LLDALQEFFAISGVVKISLAEIIMLIIALVLLYLGIVKRFEPLLLVPIGFGMLLVNLPLTGLMQEPLNDQPGGLFYYFYQGNALGIFPPLIFLGVGALTDFGPLIANPKSLLLGAAAQFGIFMTFIGAILLGFTGFEAASIGIIGGADGPTAPVLQLRDFCRPIPCRFCCWECWLLPSEQPPV